MSDDLATQRTPEPAPERPSQGRVDMTGQTLMGKLRVVRLLGEGGMGAVYEVEHLITRHRRALKVMHARYAGNTESITRFIREAGVAGTLKTPHVVETYDAGQLEDGAPYVLMELLEGEALASILERGPVPAGRMVGIACQVLEGLAVAHDAGIVHRDIKPDNLYVSQNERGEQVRVLDFGISKFTQEDGEQAFSGTLTAEGTMMGTPFYMSPEQASGAKKVDERSDLYSVGVVLYEGLSGVRPFDGHNLASLVIKIHSGEHAALAEVAPHLPAQLVAIVERAMHVDPSTRPRSARELLGELMPFAESAYTTSLKTLREVVGDAQTLSAPAMSLPQRRVSQPSAGPSIQIVIPPARPPWAIPAAFGALALAAVLGGWLFFGGHGSSPPAAPPPLPPPVAVVPPPPPEPVVAPEPVVEVEPTVAEAPSDPPPTGTRPPRVRPDRSDDGDDEEPRPREGTGRTKILRGGVY